MARNAYLSVHIATKRKAAALILAPPDIVLYTYFTKEYFYLSYAKSSLRRFKVRTTTHNEHRPLSLHIYIYSALSPTPSCINNIALIRPRV